jgi:MFS family permease
MRQATPRPGVYYGWLIVATTFWMAMFTGGGRSGFGVFVIPMSEELGWNRGTISLAAALGALISGLSQPFVGRLYDWLGGRRLILVCLLVSGLSTALVALTHHLVFLILVFGVALSIAQAGCSLTTTSALLSKWFHRQRATAMAFTTTGCV